ncbi:MAG TPA: hypothetical protein VKE95_07050 [Burkholderiales bacterium]|nr:hypothetical protein [Burkholderiales bacterium]
MVLKLSDLFEGLGSEALKYSSRCNSLSGKEVEIRGWIAQAHDGSRTVMLVNRQGDCPDCSPAPVAAVILPGFKPPKHVAGAVTLRGRLSYGLAVRNGIASYLRLERARVSTAFSP